MKRIWIGIAILLGLLVVGVLVMQVTDRQLRAVAEMLQQASETSDWEKAVTLAKAAQKDWKQKWHLMASLADHTDMECIDSVFAQLKAYQDRGDEVAHAAACAQLSEAVYDLKENHRLTWWNLL